MATLFCGYLDGFTRFFLGTCVSTATLKELESFHRYSCTVETSGNVAVAGAGEGQVRWGGYHRVVGGPERGSAGLLPGHVHMLGDSVWTSTGSHGEDSSSILFAGGWCLLSNGFFTGEVQVHGRLFFVYLFVNPALYLRERNVQFLCYGY